MTSVVPSAEASKRGHPAAAPVRAKSAQSFVAVATVASSPSVMVCPGPMMSGSPKTYRFSTRWPHPNLPSVGEPSACCVKTYRYAGAVLLYLRRAGDTMGCARAHELREMKYLGDAPAHSTETAARLCGQLGTADVAAHTVAHDDLHAVRRRERRGADSLLGPLKRAHAIATVSSKVRVSLVAVGESFSFGVQHVECMRRALLG
mmetsp:Transcript_261/g.863  ORF Transcript_261/g.863 Transcript_261/m.863 type:complete len:204 (+) Transcript_261:2336-2947(+)